MSISGSNGKHLQGIELFPNEEAFYVQREHVIVLFFPAVAIFLVTFLTIGFVLAAFYFQYIQDLFYLILMLLSALVLLSALSTYAVYTFMQWFYQFYIITSKRLIHIHYFRIGGFHLDEVFYIQTRPLEIGRHPQNFLLDFLGIEDIFVHFKNLERTVPFIFQMPPDPDKIEQLLEGSLLAGSGK